MASPIADWPTLATALDHFNEQRYAEAETICRTILERAPEDFWTLRLLSWTHIRRAQFDQANVVLEKAWRVGPPDEASAAATLADLATMNIVRRDYASALELAQAALTHKPDDVIARQNYAHALLSLGRPDEALKHFREALATEP